MSPVQVHAVRIDYPKRWFLIGAAVDAAAMAVMLWLSWGSGEAFARAFWAACAVVICGPLMLLFVPPLFTCHYAGEKGLRLRMGLLINATVPYRYIRLISDAKVTFGSVMVGIGVKYMSKRRTVFVTASFKELVSIRLDGPQQLGSPLRPLVDTIVLSVRDKEGFVALVKDRAGLGE